jgi:hypothetical protein
MAGGHQRGDGRSRDVLVGKEPQAPTIGLIDDALRPRDIRCSREHGDSYALIGGGSRPIVLEGVESVTAETKSLL